MDFDIPLFAPTFDEREAGAAAEVVRSGWISMGPRTVAFEQAFAEMIGIEHAIAVTNCTAALHLAMAMLIEPGDEVIVPSMTFVATVNAVRYAGGIPVFADIVGVHDFSLDPEDAAARITPRTRAILPMHYAGFPCAMDRLTALAAANGLALVEDAAHAPLSQFNNRPVGTFGRVGCFSFFSNKNMTTAEGGMVVTAEPSLAQRARLLRSHGMTSLSYERARGHATSYDVVAAGWNYRLDDIRAAIGLVQLERLREDIVHRAQTRQWYLDELGGIPGVIIPYRDRAGVSASHYIMPIVIEAGGSRRRDIVRQMLADRSIQTSVHYPAAHRFQVYAHPAVTLPQTEKAADHQITLPMFGSMTREQVRRVAHALGEALAQST